MPEDYYRKLIVTAATDEWLAHQQARDYVRDIHDEVRQLQDQLRHVSGFLQYLGDKLNIQEAEELPPPPFIGQTPVSRHQLIMDAASTIVGAGGETVSTQAVILELERRQIELGVQQPHAVIGTVLSRSEQFKKVATNTFEFVGRQDAL